MKNVPQYDLTGLEECDLHTRTPYGIKGVSQSQFSIARYYGTCEFNGDHYTYLPATDELIRDDVLQWKIKRAKKAKSK